MSDNSCTKSDYDSDEEIYVPFPFIEMSSLYSDLYRKLDKLNKLLSEMRLGRKNILKSRFDKLRGEDAITLSFHEVIRLYTRLCCKQDRLDQQSRESRFTEAISIAQERWTAFLQSDIGRSVQVMNHFCYDECYPEEHALFQSAVEIALPESELHKSKQISRWMIYILHTEIQQPRLLEQITSLWRDIDIYSNEYGSFNTVIDNSLDCDCIYTGDEDHTDHSHVMWVPHRTSPG
jgi:hypothetical protein